MIEDLILENLLCNETYVRKVAPFLKDEYFAEQHHKVVFSMFKNFFDLYGRLPPKEAVDIELDKITKVGNIPVGDTAIQQAKQSVAGYGMKPSQDESWLIDETERFCQDKALYNAIMNSIQIIQGKDQKLQKGSIPTILSEALGVAFDTSVGHDYLEDSDERFAFYHRIEERIPFDLDYFNKITRGGLVKKTLTVVLAGTGVGKSLFMCHNAAHYLSIGKNVLYITMEMGENMIAERIDANLMNVAIDEIIMLPKDVYQKKINRIKEKTKGKLIIKEYPTSSAGSNNFRHAINELRTKKRFVPDVVFVDYLNICTSSRLKQGSNINSYTYIKAIAEELRGLAVEFDVPIITATQTTRSGFTSSDIGLEDTSESFGLPATADLMFALISTDELAQMNQIMVKQLKSRYSDPSKIKRFVIGIDRPKMKLYDVEQHAQEDLVDSPAFDNTPTGGRIKSTKADKRNSLKNLGKMASFESQGLLD